MATHSSSLGVELRHEVNYSPPPSVKVQLHAVVMGRICPPRKIPHQLTHAYSDEIKRVQHVSTMVRSSKMVKLTSMVTITPVSPVLQGCMWMQQKEEMMQWSCPPVLYTTLSVSSCECKNPISTAKELVNLCHYGMNAKTWLELFWKILQWNKLATFNIVEFWFNFYEIRNSTWMLVSL
jgi:hypothetical protein